MTTDETLNIDAIRARADAEAGSRPGPRLIPRPGWQENLVWSQADIPALLDALAARDAEVERLRAGIAHIVDRYGNAPGIETCATMYDLRRLAEGTS